MYKRALKFRKIIDNKCSIFININVFMSYCHMAMVHNDYPIHSCRVIVYVVKGHLFYDLYFVYAVEAFITLNQ